jgi:CRP/FNR family transcriptional regulator, cyclic AMP receptor protein
MPGVALSRGPLSGLDEEELRPLLRRALTKSYPKHAVIVSEGDKSDGLYVIVSGKVRIFLANENGKEVTLGVEGPGEYFGEMTLDGGPRSASVMTLEPSRFLVVPRADLEAFLAEHPSFAVHVLRKLIRRARILTENVKSLALQDVYGRFTRMLHELAADEDGKLVIAEKLTQQEMANRIGASREMVSLILKDLAKGGYLSLSGKRITIEKKLPLEW